MRGALLSRECTPRVLANTASRDRKYNGYGPRCTTTRKCWSPRSLGVMRTNNLARCLQQQLWAGWHGAQLQKRLKILVGYVNFQDKQDQIEQLLCKLVWINCQIYKTKSPDVISRVLTVNLSVLQQSIDALDPVGAKTCLSLVIF